MNILLIEPDKIQAKQFVQALSNGGHNLTHVFDAQTAIVATDKNRPDAIIMELLLPGHSGIEFLYELRSYNEWKTIPVVILSRISQHESSLEGALLNELGIAVYLYKPETKLAKLVATINKITGR